MITGVVTGRSARIRVTFSPDRTPSPQVDAIVDTGFNGSLTLPRNLIAALQLKYHGRSSAELADGSSVFSNIYVATVIWDGQPRQILVAESNSEPLLGMQLMENYELRIQVRHRGKVTLKPIPRRMK